MKHHPRSIGSATRRVAILAGALSSAALFAIPVGASANGGGGGAETTAVTVMTRNVYLGADLSPALAAETLCEAVDGAGEIYNEVQRTDFPERAKPLAREIKKANPELVGLQEVALWRKQEPSDNGGPPISPDPNATSATEVDYDFLALLRAELKKQGVKYKVAGLQEEFEGELPADADGNDATGGICGADLDYRLTMQDVILARKDVKTSKLEMAHYDTRFETSISGIPVAADRGWLSVKAKADGAKFNFVNTHLEAFGDPEIRQAQAKELKKEALMSKGQTVLVGDLNSGLRKRHKIKGKDQLAFKVLKKFGMKDRGAVQSCCYPSAIDDPAFTFDHTVDHVLVKPGVRSKDAFVTGDDPRQMTPSGLWPSDHGGVVSTLKMPR